MSNPYLDDEEEQPAPPPKKEIPWVFIALAIAVIGCFLPTTQSCEFPSPVPPFVEPIEQPGSWVVVLEETEQRTPAIARLLGDTLYWESLANRQLKWRFYDVDSPDATAYRDYTNVGLPALLIISPDKKVLLNEKLPLDKEQLNATIKKATGL